MSAVMPGCDSDEEVFWGPVTARELEIIWRSRMANKKTGESANPVENFTKNPELNKSSGKNICSMNSSSSVQEVPSLQDMRNSSDKQKALFEENGSEHNTEDSEHESVGNESTLPLLEASMVIKQDHEEIEDVSNSSGGHSNNDDISHQGILDKNEGQEECEPESSDQVDDSKEDPQLIKNVDLVHAKDTEEKINSMVDDLNKIPQEITELHQTDDICISRINASKEYCDPSGETSDPSSTNSNVSSSDDHSNNDHNIEVVCEINHNSPEPEQIGSVDVDSMQRKSTKFENIKLVNSTISEDQSEPSDSKIKSTLNQSNIENIPPEEIDDDSAGHKEVSDDLGVSKKIGSFRKTNVSDPRLNGHNVLQELSIENQEDSINSSHVLKIDLIDKVGDGGANGASESSEEKSFVSFNSEEDNCISSSNSQHSSLNQDCPETLIVKNKENEEPSSIQSNQDCVKSKIPVSNHIKSTFIKPAKLHPTPGAINEKWLNDLKRKKIPKPKKPDYMLSPAKLESVLKSRNQPMSPNKSDVKRSAQPMSPYKSDVKRFAQPKSAISAPKPTPGSSRTLLTPRKKQFECIKSPISEYIRTGIGIPTAKSLPVLQSPNRIPVPITAKQTPVQKLPPKFYSSAEKLVVKPGSSSVLKKTENRPFLTPKIFKHQGRVADLKKPGDINVVTPRAVRKTSLTETSFACLPQSSKELEVSVLEEL
ncbi:unnamed protein product [Nezara viridula]|uniref:Uncharacterized protein n=1 Tax=Nezara viridula TaxID=85310 RepID=A0A9P0HBB1_NEZVI|nr:unnamed protein product [Nezara viridula]